MVMYFKNINGDYLVAVCTGYGNVEITKEEYDKILSIIQNRPEADAGFTYKLRTDLTWELVEVPPAPDEEPEATDEDYQAALRDMGVSV